MRNGMRCLLAMFATAIATPAVRAGDVPTQIMMEVRIVRVDDGCFEKVRGLCAAQTTKNCCAPCPDGKCCTASKPAPCGTACPENTCCAKPSAAPAQGFLPSTLSAAQVACLMECVQADLRSSILSSPKLVTLNGQDGTVQIGGEQLFVTDVRTTKSFGPPVYIPRTEAFATGVRFTVRPTATPDRKSIIMKLNAEITEIDAGQPPLFPVTTVITPVFEGGAQGQPVPFTQFIQQPSLTTRGVQKVAGVACGQTALLYAGRRTSVEESCCELPVLCELPVIGELFRCKTADVRNDHLLVLVTPQICCTEGACEVQAARELPPCFDMPIMCEEAITPAAYRSEECVPVAPKPVCATAACTKACPQACPAQCPQAVRATNVTGVWTPAACPCPTVCPCPAPCPCPMAACPLTAAMQLPTVAAAPCAYVLVPVQQFAWHAASAMPTQVVMPAPMVVRLAAGEEQSTCTIVAPPPPPPRAFTPQVAKMMRKYQQACEDGDTEKARKLAGKCLLLDPTCFAK